MSQLNQQTAQALLQTTTTEPHLFQHARAVSAAMGAMATHFGADKAYWEAVGLLHDYDYQQYPEEHLQHTEQPLRETGVDDISIRAILSHGWGICSEVEPLSDMEKSLYTMDALTGLVSATAKMRPSGIADLTPASVTKKLKDKHFAAGVRRDVILSGIEKLGMERTEIIAICIEGMKLHAQELGLMGTGS